MRQGEYKSVLIAGQ